MRFFSKDKETKDAVDNANVVDPYYRDAKVVGEYMCLHNARAIIRRDKYDKITRINNYCVKKLLGEGRYGEVYLCKSMRVHTFFCCTSETKDTDDEFAIKLVRRCDVRKEEYKILKSVQHDHIVSLVEYIDDATHPWVFLVFESLGGGPIAVCSDDGCLIRPEKPWTEEKAEPLFAQMILALEYLHGRGVFHRDIKPENVVFTSPEETDVKLIDFGESRMLKAKVKGLADDSSRVTKGTPLFMACEMLSGMRFSDSQADVWALGVLFYLLCTGYVPFGRGKKTTFELHTQIQFEVLTFPDTMSLHLQEMLTKMLDRDVAKRASLPYLKRHEWFSGVASKEGDSLEKSSGSFRGNPLRKRSPGLNTLPLLDADLVRSKSPFTLEECVSTPVQGAKEKDSESALGFILDDSILVKNMLIVEDSGKMRSQLRWLLEHSKLSRVNLELSEMQYVEDALEKMLNMSKQGTPFDLVIMDIYPRNNGTTQTGVDAIIALREFEHMENLDPTPVWFSYSESEPFPFLDDTMTRLKTGIIEKPFTTHQARSILCHLGVRCCGIQEEEFQEMVEQSNHFADAQFIASQCSLRKGSLPTGYLDRTNIISVPDDYTSKDDEFSEDKLEISLGSGGFVRETSERSLGQ